MITPLVNSTPFVNSEQPTHIFVIIDKSSSMQHRAREVIDGFNQFIKEQKALPGKAFINLVYFDSYVSNPVTACLLENFNRLDETNYVPGGMTALNDAVGQTITHARNSLGDHAKVIFCIMTDGEENSSREYNTQRVKQLVEHQQGVNWKFIFLGANLNAFAQANAFGIDAFTQARYSDKVVGGTLRAMSSVTNAVASYRSSSVGAIDANWANQLQNDVEQEKKGQSA